MSFAPYQNPPDDNRQYTPLRSENPFAGTSGGVYRSTEPPPAGQARVNTFETGLGLRVDIEAALAYALGPFSGILLLILERHNDYVRFHAWQSSLVFTIMIFLHFVFMFISEFLSWVLFIADLVLILVLGYQAYIHGQDDLVRYKVPFIGNTASEWVDIE